MGIHYIRDMSRLKKKLLLYFILVDIVSVSVSAEIILELSTPEFRTSLSAGVASQLETTLSPKDLTAVKKILSRDDAWAPLYDMRNRMILLLLVISSSVFGAFFLFTRDIVSPMDGLVEAAKKIASGDFTAAAPVMSRDEIGQLAMLLNDMNINLQDMVVHIKREIDRHKEKIESASIKNESILKTEADQKFMETKRITMAQYQSFVDLNGEIKVLLWRMNNDMAALQAYIGSYKTYAIPSEITQDEIESSLRDFHERSSTGTEEAS